MSKISSIGTVTDNIESSVNSHLIPCKCKSCGSTTAIFERLSGQFETIPVLLPIELGHIIMKDLSVSKIDQQFTINHDQQSLHYKLAGFYLYPKTLLRHSNKQRTLSWVRRLKRVSLTEPTMILLEQSTPYSDCIL